MPITIAEYTHQLCSGLASVPEDSLQAALSVLREARKNGRTVYVVGNGGSASTASHMACDLNKNTFKEGLPPLRIMSLADNVAHITALANDLSYEDIFVGQMHHHFGEGDVLIAISASGNSPNIIRAVEFALGLSAPVIGLTGFGGGKLRELATVSLHVDCQDYGPVEDAHLVLNHLLVLNLREG